MTSTWWLLHNISFTFDHRARMLALGLMMMMMMRELTELIESFKPDKLMTTATSAHLNKRMLSGHGRCFSGTTRRIRLRWSRVAREVLHKISRVHKTSRKGKQETFTFRGYLPATREYMGTGAEYRLQETTLQSINLLFSDKKSKSSLDRFTYLCSDRVA